MLLLSRINFRMLVRVTGWLVMIEAFFMLFPLVTAIIYRESEVFAFGVGVGITAVVGAAMTFLSRPQRSDMSKRDGFLFTALVWVVFSLFGMIPLLISDTPLNVSEAFFESMSGFTTTGVSIMQVDSLPHAIHIWRSLMQWIGGMGIILFTLAVLPMLNSSGGMQMFNAEVASINREKLRPRVSSTAKRLWLVYALLTLVLIVLYCLGPMGTFDSVCHALSTMSTGGFSTRQESIVAWNSLYVKVVTTLFMFIGGVNFALIFKASTGDFRSLWQNEVFRLFVKMILVLWIVFDIYLALNPSVPHTWETFTIDPLFQIVSVMSSTGFVVENLADWGVPLLCLIFIMMFFGACAGSTSGGAKLDRALYVWKNSRNELYRCVYPNHVLSLNVNGKAMTPEVINKVMVFIGLYISVVIVGGLLLTLMDVPLVDSFFAAVGCMSNDALSLELIGSGGDYVMIPDAGKWVLSFLMLTGRLELFTVLVLFTPGFWRK